MKAELAQSLGTTSLPEELRVELLQSSIFNLLSREPDFPCQKPHSEPIPGQYQFVTYLGQEPLSSVSERGPVIERLIRDLKQPRRRRERHDTIGLIRSTIALHVRFQFLYI